MTAVTTSSSCYLDSRIAVIDNGPGTGIGLKVVKQLVEGMAGTFGFESNSGEGTKFWINLPVT